MKMPHQDLIKNLNQFWFKNSDELYKTLIIASRPKTLLASLSPVLVGICLALRSISDFNLNLVFTSFIILLCAFCIQILSNFVNDLWDFYKGSDTKERIGPLRVVQAGLISPTQMQQVILILTAMIILLGSFLVFKGGLIILIIGIVSIIGAYAYTAGPYPLAHNGLGELFVTIFFGPVPVFGTYYLLTNEISLVSLTIGLPLGIIASAILQVNNIRDFKEDYKSGKRTIAVRTGLDFAIKLFKFSLLAAVGIAILSGFVLMGQKVLWLVLFLPLSLILTKELRSLESGKDFNDFLPKVALSLFIFSVSLSTLLIIS